MPVLRGLFRLDFRHVEEYNHLGQKVTNRYEAHVGWAYIGLFLAGVLKGCGAY